MATGASSKVNPPPPDISGDCVISIFQCWKLILARFVGCREGVSAADFALRNVGPCCVHVAWSRRHTLATIEIAWEIFCNMTQHENGVGERRPRSLSIEFFEKKLGWGGRIRTSEWRNQNPFVGFEIGRARS